MQDKTVFSSKLTAAPFVVTQQDETHGKSLRIEGSRETALRAVAGMRMQVPGECVLRGNKPPPGLPETGTRGMSGDTWRRGMVLSGGQKTSQQSLSVAPAGVLPRSFFCGCRHEPYLLCSLPRRNLSCTG